jgi:serine/threonine protein kinase
LTKIQALATYNEKEIDPSHFLETTKVLGLGGFGMVRATVKLTGADKNIVYALKSLSKHTILQRASGLAAVMSELRSLALLVDSKFVCKVHYAFQDAAYLYMVLDLAVGGDMRYNMRATANCRFPEERARFYISQVILAVESCHKASVLHRGMRHPTL